MAAPVHAHIHSHIRHHTRAAKLAAMPKAVAKPYVRFRPNLHQVQRGLIHVVFLIACCDLVAACWPAFDAVWTHISHLGVALGGVLASCAEYVAEYEDKHSGGLAGAIEAEAGHLESEASAAERSL